MLCNEHGADAKGQRGSYKATLTSVSRACYVRRSRCQRYVCRVP